MQPVHCATSVFDVLLLRLNMLPPYYYDYAQIDCSFYLDDKTIKDVTTLLLRLKVLPPPH